MISGRYILRKPPPPSPVVAFVNQAIVPTLIDSVAIAERLLERIAVRTRRSPLTGLGIACGLGWLASLVAPARQGRR